MKAYQLQPGDKLNGAPLVTVAKENKTHIRYITQGQRRGILVHHTKELLDIETDRPISGVGFSVIK